ncbi:uncharacterized protein BDW70DRAFT_142157 [Aspergillus foveolatus]|uniref:uncharacterized protein n=1 Tax=Aspergillus foveolatus TaxID=210207 RepID=UPI003CCE4370
MHCHQVVGIALCHPGILKALIMPFVQKAQEKVNKLCQSQVCNCYELTLVQVTIVLPIWLLTSAFVQKLASPLWRAKV